MGPTATLPRSLVRQEGANGCGLAALAMVTGQTYADVKAWMDERFPDRCSLGDEQGLTHVEVDEFLGVHGFVYRYTYVGWRNEVWPPTPFAPVHIANVKQPSGNSHYVVVTADGSVLDPLEHGDTLDYWPKVQNVMGIWPEPRNGSGETDHG